jgi:hypothetical protein
VASAGFDALVKRWNKCITVGGGYAESCDLFTDCRSYEARGFHHRPSQTSCYLAVFRLTA